MNRLDRRVFVFGGKRESGAQRLCGLFSKFFIKHSKILLKKEFCARCAAVSRDFLKLAV
jgi:hypothetical protein